MKLKLHLGWWVALLAILSGGGAIGRAGVDAAAATRPATRPNIVFLFTDDQRADTIASLGNRHIHTPHLDRLTAEGTTFTRAYCMGGRQAAVCVASRAMLMSGRTIFHARDDLQGQETWPANFGATGYDTFITGKWHNGPASLLRSFQQGEAVFLGGMSDPYKLPLQDISADRRLVNKRLSKEHAEKRFADSAIRFLKRREGERPFLIYVAFSAPHDPRTAPEAYRDRYDPATMPLPANFMPHHPFDNGAMTLRDEMLAPFPRTADVVRRHLADYYAYITYLDDEIGRILDALKESGQWDNTIIVFSSDHGLAIGSHGLFGKQNLYDHSMHAPLIFSGPAIARGKRSDALCYLHDIFPTLGELAGVKGPAESEGQSLARIIAGKETSVRDSLFTAYTTAQRAVRDDRWKLIAYPLVNKIQLFDLQSDPAEMHDLAENPAHADQAKRMMDLLRSEQRRLDDKQPLTTVHPAPLEFDFKKIEQLKRGDQ